MSSAVEIEHLSVMVKGRELLRDIDFKLEEGIFLGIVGPNGGGKTTLIRHLNGLLKPPAETIRIDGLDVAHSGNEVRKRVGMVFQDADSQIVGETVREDVSFGPENLGFGEAELNERVHWALQTLDRFLI